MTHALTILALVVWASLDTETIWLFYHSIDMAIKSIFHIKKSQYTSEVFIYIRYKHKLCCIVVIIVGQVIAHLPAQINHGYDYC